MNQLTQLTLGEALEFISMFQDETVLTPCWNRGMPSPDDTSRICFTRTSRGTVRTFREAIFRAIRANEQNHYNHETLLDTRYRSKMESFNLGMLIAAVNEWKGIGET
jgi:hypothetical protein